MGIKSGMTNLKSSGDIWRKSRDNHRNISVASNDGGVGGVASRMTAYQRQWRRSSAWRHQRHGNGAAA